MKTVYTNTRHPKLILWGSIAIGAIGVACLVLYIVFSNESYLFSVFYSLIYFAVFFSQYKLSTYTFDDEADTITYSELKKYPLRMSDITTIIYMESKKGRFRKLFIHDSGTGFMEILTSKANADKMVAQILKANPAAKVSHANYI